MNADYARALLLGLLLIMLAPIVLGPFIGLVLWLAVKTVMWLGL